MLLTVTSSAITSSLPALLEPKTFMLNAASFLVSAGDVGSSVTIAQASARNTTALITDIKRSVRGPMMVVAISESKNQQMSISKTKLASTEEEWPRNEVKRHKTVRRF